MKKTLFSHFLTILILTGCGGGGGGGSSSASANQSSTTNDSSSTTYSYDRIASDYTSKVWDTVSIGRFTGEQQYITDYSIDVITGLTENSAAIDLSMSGTKLWEKTSFSHSWQVNDQNLDGRVELVSCEDTSLVTGYIGTQSFANADVVLITNDSDYMAGLNIQYVDVALVRLVFKDGSARADTFPMAYGDATASGDLPTSGSKQYDLDFTAILEVWENSGSSANVLAEGNSDLQVNFGSNLVSGTITFNKFWNGELWLQEGGGCSGSQIFGVDDLELQVSGTISNGDISADININQTDANDGQITAGTGVLFATLFGPQGYEMGASFFFYERGDADTNDDVLFWDGFGVGVGD